MANVLLVDDDGSVLLTLAIALRRYGHTVTVACDGNQALLHLKRHQFAYLVSDVRMPGMSGIELATRARRLTNPPRVILTSAYSNIQMREGMAEAFLQKPIDTERLNAILSADSGTPADQPNSNPPAAPDTRPSRDTMRPALRFQTASA